MATIGGKFIHGLVNNLLYREYRGKQIVQSMPDTSKNHRTAGTKKAAKVFGRASKLAFHIRVGLSWATGRFYDGTMIYRFNTEILHCLNSVKNTDTETFNFKADTFLSLVGFEFNVGSPLRNHLLVRPDITLNGTTLQVNIPEIKVPIELKFPDRSEGCKLLIVTTMIDLVHNRTKFLSPQIMDIPYSYKPIVVPEQTIEFEVVPGCLCITAISLQYVKSSFAGDMIINTKSFNPAAILHAYIADGTVDPLVTERWGPIDFGR